MAAVTDEAEQRAVDLGEGGAVEDGVIRLKIDETDGDDIPIQETSQVSNIRRLIIVSPNSICSVHTCM